MRRGFTLIELLAAVAILAVVSVMAVQVLGGAMLQRDRLLVRDDAGSALALVLALLRRDIEAIAPLPASRDGEGAQAALIISENTVEFERAGLMLLDDAGGLYTGEIRWTVRDGAVFRQVSGPGGDGGAEERLLDGVRGLSIGALGEAGDALLPAPGYEITFDTRDWGSIRLVVAR